MTKFADKGFLANLRGAGVWDAASDLGCNPEAVFLPLAETTEHPYRDYSWSVNGDEFGNLVINAVPPESEHGWTPWERWLKIGGRVVHEAIVLYPVRPEFLKKGVPQWYAMGSKELGLNPLFLDHQSLSIDEQLRLARVDVAAECLGIDYKNTFLAPMQNAWGNGYSQCRWVVVPHRLGYDFPVIYALPPMHMSDTHPWESWYTVDGVTCVHHTHYTKPFDGMEGEWSEFNNAPQRPNEIYGVTWYWKNLESMLPEKA